MFQIFSKIGWYIKAHWLRYIIAITFLNMASIISVIPPRILQEGIDQIVNRTMTKSSLMQLILEMGVMIVCGYFISFIWNYLLFSSGNDIEYTIRKNYFKHLLNMDGKFYQRNFVGDLMARATSDLSTVARSASYGILTLVDSTFFLFFIVFMMCYTVSLKLTLVSLIPLPFIVIGVRVLGQKIHKTYTISQNAFSELNNKVLESVSGVRVVRAYVQEHEDIARLDESAVYALKKNNNLIKINALFDPVFRAVFTIANTIAFGYGSYMVINQQLSPGELVSFTIYLGMLGWPMFALGDTVNTMSRGNASYIRIQNVLNQKSEVVNPIAPLYAGDRFNKLEFKAVSFRYPDGEFDAIKNIDFVLEKGKTLGIVGKTGSGKTTVIRQILKQYKLEHGSIKLNGIEIDALETAKVRSFFGYVPQEHILFTGTVYRNIAFGKKDSTPEEVERAIDLAAFRKDIAFLDKGLETVVGEQGVMLSGGQKQRLSIARAFVTDPQVLILDDSLSAVDGSTEKEILRNIKNIRKGKTTVIIAHRLSAVEHADEIIVMQDGVITERGTHEELMALKGWYAAQYIHQQMLQIKESDE